MVFSSNIFLFLFLPAVLISYFLAPKLARNYILLIASLFFYAWGEASYIVVLIISIIANYFFGIGVGKFINHDNQKEKSKANIFLALAIIINLILLGYFKYANFVIDNLNSLISIFANELKIEYHQVHLPIGISFFTFHSISYIVDIYRKKVKAQKNIFDLALYISLFPQLVAGPIVRYNTIAKQLDVKKRRHHPLFITYGIRRFIIGLGKKVIIANPLGQIADTIFALPESELSTYLAWAGIVCYSLQIFFDFSGYSDMAIGLARIFGFRFLENFNYPYISKSIKEFWRRWHISLSSWFRDYLYIPLGGNKCSVSRQYFNLILVFFLCGFWHGASWNFIIWGLFHGLFLVLERTRFGIILDKLVILSRIYSLLIIMVGWVFFRSSDLSYALSYLQKMFYFQVAEVPGNVGAMLNGHFYLTAFWVGMLMTMPWVNFIKKIFLIKNRARISSRLIFVAKDLWLIAIFILVIIRLASGTHNPFIYFQF